MVFYKFSGKCPKGSISLANATVYVTSTDLGSKRIPWNFHFSANMIAIDISDVKLTFDSHVYSSM